MARGSPWHGDEGARERLQPRCGWTSWSVALAAREPDVPLIEKLCGLSVAAYAVSQIDLIPDFSPVIGLLDDLLLLPHGIWVAPQLIPACLRQELQRRARDTEPSGLRWLGAALAAVLWLAVQLVTAAFHEEAI